MEESSSVKIKSLIEKAKALGTTEHEIKDCNNKEKCLKDLIAKKEYESLVNVANKKIQSQTQKLS